MHDETRFLDQDGRLQQWPSKHTDQSLVLAYLATKFDLKAAYSEAAVNAILQQWHTFGDWPFLRRELYDRNFLDRNPDGSDYRLKRITTKLANLLLVGPNIVTDPSLAVPWLEGDAGRETLRLMANTAENNQPSTLQDEQQRIRDFVTSVTQRTWMLNYAGNTVGAIWLDLQPTEYLLAPSIHIMIGNPSVRGQGIGEAAVRAIAALVAQEGAHKTLYSRYLLQNAGSAGLLAKVGFTKAGDMYEDADGLGFQNMKFTLLE